MEEVEHEHELKLIDMHLQYADQHLEEDDEVFFIFWRQIGTLCHICKEEINLLHRYYYRCMGEMCTFSVHEFCYDLPRILEHPLHPHPLILTGNPCGQIFENRCRICQTHHENSAVHYQCFSCYDFFVYVSCALKIEKNTIHHPSHPHLLMSAIAKHILCECNACGKRHEGVFYQCTTCVGFTIHKDCAKLPRNLLIQERTDGAFYHFHPLTLSYSFPEKDQKAKHHPRCRVCTNGFYDMENLWIYKCDVCMYYAHLDCATSRGEPFMSIFSPAGSGKSIKNYEDVDHPHLLHLPFPDESYSLPKHLFFKESGTFVIDKVNLQHISHPHPLILVDGQTSSSKIKDSLLLMCHNPMKKTQLLCNGCLRPITSTMPFYKCPHQSCNNFALHEWCTRLPQKIENHPGHPQHTLHLMYSHVLPHFFGVFLCDVCNVPCNGFSYCCVECEYYVDVGCGLIPQQITHKAHPDHLLSIVRKSFFHKSCHICLLPNKWSSFIFSIRGFRQKDPVFFSCNICDVYIHPECALLLSEKIMHKCDKHLMHLSYLPIENHKSEYFCEICEEDLNPHESFYHCHDCVQSIHTACAPLILHCETNTYTWEQRSIYYYVNIKFGGNYNTDAHPHPLSFSQGIMSDGECKICRKKLHCQMIFKCQECEFALDYKCCRSL
ncbi:uncharacterized protein LOC111898882 [Lactuca sativa]|uniref:Phorbol-ester/DAG-type domain-containing protein n=1 Tax=Lactuca sativa TaxID=4236 RepID=A0A9R1WVU8_LACSA|nr:uncharacterized protein LOC111898882 [Lactuca sativa]KAJ0189244.1 hypothetical protein LSAT_V11C800420820 [Lactuca sativa]